MLWSLKIDLVLFVSFYCKNVLKTAEICGFLAVFDLKYVKNGGKPGFLADVQDKIKHRLIF